MIIDCSCMHKLTLNLWLLMQAQSAAAGLIRAAPYAWHWRSITLQRRQQQILGQVPSSNAGGTSSRHHWQIRQDDNRQLPSTSGLSGCYQANLPVPCSAPSSPVVGTHSQTDPPVYPGQLCTASRSAERQQYEDHAQQHYLRHHAMFDTTGSAGSSDAAQARRRQQQDAWHIPRAVPCMQPVQRQPHSRTDTTAEHLTLMSRMCREAGVGGEHPMGSTGSLGPLQNQAQQEDVQGMGETQAKQHSMQGRVQQVDKHAVQGEGQMGMHTAARKPRPQVVPLPALL